VALWGLGMGVQESIIPAAVAPMISPDRRASAYGLFTGVYGTAWVLGSVVIGVLFDVSLGAVTAFTVTAQLAAIPLILQVRRRTAAEGHPGWGSAGLTGSPDGWAAWCHTAAAEETDELSFPLEMPVAEVARFAAQQSGERAELEAASGRLREEDSAYVDALRLLAGQPTLVLPRNASQRDRERSWPPGQPWYRRPRAVLTPAGTAIRPAARSPVHCRVKQQGCQLAEREPARGFGLPGCARDEGLVDIGADVAEFPAAAVLCSAIGCCRLELL
jgi:hypothetical protein